VKPLRTMADEALLEERDEEAARRRLGMSQRVWSRVVHGAAPARRQRRMSVAELREEYRSTLKGYGAQTETKGITTRSEIKVDDGLDELGREEAPPAPEEETMVEQQGGKWVSAEVAARALGMSESTVRSWGVKGKIQTRPETYLGRPIKRYWLTDEQIAAGADQEAQKAQAAQKIGKAASLSEELNAARKSCGQAEAELAKVRELLDASQARESYLDKELLETKELLEDEQRKHGDLVIECAQLQRMLGESDGALEEAQATIARQLDQLAKARAQTNADVDERVRDLERALEGARADAETKTRLLDVVARERDGACEEIRELRKEVGIWESAANALRDERKERDALRPDHDLLAELRTLLLTHGETLEAAGAEHVYYLHYRVSQALEGAWR
jgi:hypothetical protein